MIDSNKISEIASRIATKFNPDKIILFGSYANGTQKEDSDIDLLIIQETDLPIQNRGYEIRMSLMGSMMPFDIVIYTNSEFDQEKDKSSSFLNTVMKNSKLLYERQN